MLRQAHPHQILAGEPPALLGQASCVRPNLNALSHLGARAAGPHCYSNNSSCQLTALKLMLRQAHPRHILAGGPPGSQVNLSCILPAISRRAAALLGQAQLRAPKPKCTLTLGSAGRWPALFSNNSSCQLTALNLMLRQAHPHQILAGEPPALPSQPQLHTTRHILAGGSPALLGQAQSRAA